MDKKVYSHIMETDNHIIHTVDSVIVHMHQLACGLKGSSGAATNMYSYPHVHMYSYLHLQLPTCTATYMYSYLHVQSTLSRSGNCNHTCGTWTVETDLIIQVGGGGGGGLPSDGDIVMKGDPPPSSSWDVGSHQYLFGGKP